MYGRGEIPITHLPPQQLHKSRSGYCDYCNKKKSVVRKTKTQMYDVCWPCECYLKHHHGEEWEQKAETTLQQNKQKRMQLQAQKESGKMTVGAF